MGERAAAPWRAQYGSVYRFVRRRTSSQEEAEDLTQEVFLAAIEALGQARLDTETPPLAWLYTVARRRLIDRLRASSHLTVSFDFENLPALQEQRWFGPFITEAILDGLNALDSAQRRVIVLKLFEGRSFAEIGAEMGATEAACRMRLSRGLAALRSGLERKGITP